MNWKNYCYLFVNGKFKVEWYFNGKVFGTYDILGYANDEGSALLVDGTDGSQHDYIFPKHEKMNLIARPISDMSNSEVAKALSYQNIEHEGRDFRYFKNLLSDIVNETYDEEDAEFEMIPLTAKAQNYLLSIGVYPFDDKEDVKFVNKNSN